MASVDELEARARQVAADWHHAPYYEQAEEWVPTFWGDKTVFRTLFDRLNHERILDLACGRGRHSWQMRDWPNTKILVDVVAANIEACRARFAGIPNVEFILNNGYDLSAVSHSGVTAVFSYDAMVHFDHAVVGSYLGEIERVLEPSGMALIHHSNYTCNSGGNYRDNPHWRNFMPPGQFIDYSTKVGLQVVQHIVMDWAGVPNLDAVTLLAKPSR